MVYLVIIAASVFGLYWLVLIIKMPNAKEKALAKLKTERRLIDNDNRLIETFALWRSLAFSLMVVTPAALGAPLLFFNEADKIGKSWITIVLMGVSFAITTSVYIIMAYQDTYKTEARRRSGGKRESIDVHKMHTVDNTRGEVLAKLGASGSSGPLAILRQLDTEVVAKAEQERRRADPWKLDGWRISEEDRAIVVGVPGAGKTTFLLAQIVDWMASGRSFVATDIKPEIWSILKENGLFEKFGYVDYVINPTNPSAHRFNLFSEIEDDADLNEVLSVIIPPGEGDAAVFADNARRLLKAVLAHLGDGASLPAARDFIMEAGKVEDLLAILRQSEKRSVQRIAFETTNAAGNDRLMASIMTAMSRAFEFMDDDRINDAIGVSDFSVKNALMKPRQAIFLQFEQKYKSSLATLFGGTVAYILRILQANANDREYAVFVALDEIINAAPIPKFAESLNTMRSARMPLAMYLQSIEGLNRLYGPNASEVFLGSSDLKAIFRLNDNATAEYISAQLGDTEQRAFNAGTSVTTSRDLNGGIYARRSESSASTSGYAASTARVLEAADVLNLEPGKAIVIYRGSGARFTMPSYWKDYPMPARASLNPRPQAQPVAAMEAA